MPHRNLGTQNPVHTIVTTDDLTAYCNKWAQDEFITVDTEFLRETTYYPKLCLIQVSGTVDAALIDPMAPGIDLSPFFDLMANEKVVKVFHAAKQDFEILYLLAGALPKPVMDTQIAAMVCGFGDQVGYEAIVRKLAGGSIDKSSQFTDWSRRPLTQKQLAYAIADVTYLRIVYQKLKELLDKNGREAWLIAELKNLTEPSTYRADPEQSWRRIKARIQNRKQQAVLMSVAAWREREAQNRDVPRGRVLKDEAVAEIAIQIPQSAQDVNELRLVSRGTGNSNTGAAILKAVADGLARDPDTVPFNKGRPDEMSASAQSAAEILKLALKIICEAQGIAPKLVASASDIEALAMDDNADVPATKGWQREVFGNLALDLKHGRACITMDKGKAVIRHM
ncbi:ribonuclease D [Aestuariivirga litoralis]|uniref:ribonuclease D n=1 Tax=Aestuariivirga litoralis TaxID=2650924 RepID=UPI0018C627EF|nr:ribonuclease D [Aestuariivirga litoralis]MBG1231239.1 ribonuclease D [Aestuariivirga litoralis]